MNFWQSIYLTLSLLFALSQTKVVKFGDRYEYFEPISAQTIINEDATVFENKFISKTFDKLLFQYPPRESVTDLGNFPLELIPGLKVSYYKGINETLTGLHRKISYTLNIEVPIANFDVKQFEKQQCHLAVIDYVDKNFYIDIEEIEPSNDFRFIENERMDIEKMNQKAKQYSYAIDFKLNPSNTALEENLTKINLTIELQYHLRYGEANNIGNTLYKLAQTFDIASNCIKANSDTNTNAYYTGLMEVPRYRWILNQLFPEGNYNFFLLNENAKVQSFVLPVGNTNYGKIVKLSTIGIFLYGMTIIFFAMVTTRLSAKKKIKTE